MKLKKLAAVAMAAVMSVAMLTACSGGGSGSSPAPNGTAYTEECELVEKFVNGEYKKITENAPYYYKDYITSNGTWVYSKSINVDSKGQKEVYESLYSMSESYIVNTDAEPWKAYKEQPEAPDPDEGDSGEDDTQKPSSNVTEVAGTESYNGVEYDTITKTTVSHKGMDNEHTTIETKYYIKGTKTQTYERTETWKNGQRVSGRVEKVRLTNTVDPDSVAKLNISKYTLVDSEDELA